MDCEDRLKEYMKKNGIKGEHLRFEESCHTAEEAAKAAGAKEGEAVIKNVCLMTGKGEMILAIVKGNDRASTTRIGELLGIERPRTATPDEMLEKTGYPMGGIPSFGHGLKTIIDDAVTRHEWVYTSGGTPNTLVRMKPEELARACNAQVARIRK